LRGGPGINSPGQLAGEASLKTLPMRAYELKDYQIGGPATLNFIVDTAATIPFHNTLNSIVEGA
jgi:hypothetical protein